MVCLAATIEPDRGHRLECAKTTLRHHGADLRGQPLRERRNALHQAIAPIPGVQLIEHVETHGEPLFRAIVDGDHEGIVAKRADAAYQAGPCNAWLKIKNRTYSRRDAVEWHGARR
jgi:ATP-dependent DNA ligase